MMREVSLETLPNVNIHDPSHDKKSSDYVCNWVDKPKCIQINKESVKIKTKKSFKNAVLKLRALLTVVGLS